MIYLFGEVNEEMAKYFFKRLDKLLRDDKPITIRLCSGGGDADYAIAIATTLRSLVSDKRHVFIEAAGTVQSAATLILASGSMRSMTQGSIVMVHEGSSISEGTTAERIKSAKQAKRDEKNWDKLMETYTTTSADKWGALSRATTYLSAKQCLKLGLIDEVI